jgi:hypothetical protein
MADTKLSLPAIAAAAAAPLRGAIALLAVFSVLLALLIACDGNKQDTADAGKAPDPKVFATFAGALARNSGLLETSDYTEYIFFQGCGKQPPRPTGGILFASPRDRQEAHDKWDNWEKCVETKARECCTAAVLQGTSDSPAESRQRPKRKLQ